MMQQAGGQGAESLHPSSPRGGSGAGGSGNSFSLLGQQLTSFGSGQQKQQQQQGHPHTAPSSQAGGMSFSLGMHAHGQSFSQGHQQPQPQQQQQQQPPHQSQPNGNNSNGDGGGFPGMSQNVNSLGLSGQGYNSNQHFMTQQMLQQASGGVADFLKMSQQEGVQPASQGSLPSGAGVESLMNALSTIQQKISQLQAIVPFMGQNQQIPNAVQQQQVQQQAAAAISQIAQVAANMFPSKQQQQQQQNMASGPQQQQQQQQITNANHQFNQLFGAAVGGSGTGFNFFQHGGCPPGGSGSGMGNNTYAPLQGGSGGLSMDMSGPPVTAASTGNLGNQLGDGGVSGNTSNVSGQGLGGGGVASKSAPTGGSGQGFGTGGGSGGGAGPGTGGTGGGGNGGAAGGGQGGGGNNGASMATSVNSTMVARPRQGDPLPSQMGGGMNSRGGSVPPSGDGMPHLSSRASMNSGIAVTGSPMDERDDLGGGVLDDDDDGDAENLLPGQYDLVEMDASEILAEHTHFCEICGKGFKRDANLRMHMRGHGDEYKTPAALARPDKASHEVSVVRQRRFSCPYVGCKRNKKHRKFQPLKTMLCVKNHYRRSHCPKILICQKCKTKKFSVVADLKTHEKHCGCDKWQCSCGTTFSRKDKLIGHIGLFTGHTPAMPFTDVDGSGHLDVSEMGGGAGNPPSLSNAGNNSTGYGMSAGGNLNPGNNSGMGLGGGSGMGLGENGLQGLSSRGGSQGGGNSLSVAKDGNVLAPENSSSSDSFPSPGNLLPNSTMHSLFMNSLLQSSSGGNSSPEGLH